jgi:hypothetical protein
MSIDWQTALSVAAPIVGSIGGIVGLIGGSLGIYYATTANRVLIRRFNREEDAKDVEARVDELLRRAHESAYASQSGSSMRVVTLELTGELDNRAAWKLHKDGRAEMPQGGHCQFFVDKLPKAIRRDLELRAHSSPKDDC